MAIFRFGAFSNITESGNGSTGWITTRSGSGDATTTYAYTADASIVSGNNGSVSAELISGAGTGSSYPQIGLHSSNAATSFLDWLYTLYVDSATGNWHVDRVAVPVTLNGSTLASSNTQIPRIRVEDAGATIVCEVSTTGGSSWTTIHTITGVSPVTLYPKSGFNAAGSMGPWDLVSTAPVTPDVALVGAGTVVYSTDNPAAGYPAESLAADDGVFLVVGTKPDTTPSSAPSGWTLVDTETGGGGTTGVDNGPTTLQIYRKDTVSGSESGTVTVTVTGNSVSWAQILAFRSITGSFDVAAVSGIDSTTGATFSATMGSDPGIEADDVCFVALCTPTDATTGVSAQAISATGISAWAATVETGEPDSATGNDIGGSTFYARATTGTSSAAPVITATFAGTTTNVRGPAILVRLRAGAGGPTYDAIDVDDADVFLSPYNWYETGSGASATATSNNTGSYLKIRVNSVADGAVRLLLDTTSLTGITGVDCPQLRITVDGTPSLTQLAYSATEVTLTLASGLTAGNHDIEVAYKAFGDSTGGDGPFPDRWTTPALSWTITGIEVTTGSTLVAPTLRPKRLLCFGSSLCEAYNSAGATGAVASSDSALSYAWQLADLYDAEVGMVGWSGIAWNFGPGNGTNIPAFPSTWSNYSNGRSRLTSGFFSPTPDLVTVEIGGLDDFSDVPALETLAETELAEIVTAANGGLVAFVPPSRPFFPTAVEGVVPPTGAIFVDPDPTRSFVAGTDTTDGDHYNAAYQGEFAAGIYAGIEPYLGEFDGSTTAVTTATATMLGVGSFGGACTVTSTATATAVGVASVAGSATVATTATAAALGVGAVNGASSSTTTATAACLGVAAFDGTASCSSTATASALGVGALSGASAASTTATASALGVASIAGACTVTTTASATFEDDTIGGIDGASVVTTTATASMTGVGAFGGAASATTTGAASALGVGGIGGSAAVATTATAAALGVGSVSGASSATTTATATALGVGSFGGAATVVTSASATFEDDAVGGIDGAAVVVTTALATARGVGAFSGASTGVSLAVAAMLGVGLVAGAAAATSTASASALGVGSFGGACVVSSTATATFDETEAASFGGAAAVVSTATASIQGVGSFGGACAVVTSATATFEGSAPPPSRGKTRLMGRRNSRNRVSNS